MLEVHTLKPFCCNNLGDISISVMVLDLEKNRNLLLCLMFAVGVRVFVTLPVTSHFAVCGQFCFLNLSLEGCS